MSANELLQAYNAQLRAHVADRLPASVHVEREWPLTRTVGFGGQGWVEYRDLGGLEGEALDELIARQVAVFAERGERFEWKLHGHDRPADLPDRLRAAGFEPEPRRPSSLRRRRDRGRPRAAGRRVIREVTERADLRRIGAMEEEVWDEDHAGWSASPTSARRIPGAPDLRRRGRRGGRLRRLDPFPVRDRVRDALGRLDAPCLARAGDLPRARRPPGTARRGARTALPRADASDDSRPILERLGFVAVTTTTPYVWSPPA